MISGLILLAGVLESHSLTRVDRDLRIMYTEYTLAATELGHVTANLMRYRSSILRALEANTKSEYERISASLPDQRARIKKAIDRYVKAGPHAMRMEQIGASELREVEEKLGAYFAAADETLRLLAQSWEASSSADAVLLRNKAELHAAKQAGPRLIEVTLALDRLLEVVAEIAGDVRNEADRQLRVATVVIIFVSAGLAALVMFGQRVPTTPS